MTAKIAVLSNPTANKIYALGDGLGGVCDLGLTDISGATISIEGETVKLTKTGAFTAPAVKEGDPILITAGTYILPGMKTQGPRIDDNSILLADSLDLLRPYATTLTITTVGQPQNNDTITFTPPTWYSGTPITYRWRDVNNVLGGGAFPLAAANDILIGAALINSLRSLQRAINQIANVGTDYFAGTSGLSWLWASPPNTSGTTGLLTVQGRMILPMNPAGASKRYGVITGSITGGTVTYPDFQLVSRSAMTTADTGFRLPAVPGNYGNTVGRGRLLGAMALSSGAAFPGDAKITCYNAGYISDAAGATQVYPRSDYFQGYGNFAPVAITLPVSTFVPFNTGETGGTIGKQGFLFTISGTSPVVAVYYDDN